MPIPAAGTRKQQDLVAEGPLTAARVRLLIYTVTWMGGPRQSPGLGGIEVLGLGAVLESLAHPTRARNRGSMAGERNGRPHVGVVAVPERA